MEYTSIGESCSVVSGGTPSRSKNEYWENGNIPWIKIGNIKSKYVNEYDELITEQGLNNSSAKLLKKGTILYTIFATLGEVGILDIEACTNQAIAGIKITDPRITTDYLYYYLKSKKDYVNNIGRGVAQNNINLTTLKNFEIPLIDVDKQLNIVEILEKVERMICLKEKEIDDLDLLIKARFIEMFGDPIVNEKGWRTKPLLDMGQCKNGMNFHYDDKGIDINCLGVCDFKNFSVIDNTKVLPTVSLNEMPSEEYLLKDDDIVFVRSNGNKALVGRSLVVYPGNVPTTFSGFCIRYRKYDNEIIVPYLLRVLKTDSVRMKMSGRGANIQNLNQQILGTLVIPVPPIELQEQFADFVQQVDKSRFDIKKSIIELEREVVYD
ncbi:restriction endonuclease subunit S [Holdemanella biformis]|uniref:restriction endonuclease subunit S n=1 Tax=Holdemanella biformis TaxID=1735 RepID=UPI001D15D1D4|nr:restriction endonuclease subunit S [Holdemanella biformis]MCC3354438.1 restriction endonuclease subunit S [Holdemanella biformis]